MTAIDAAIVELEAHLRHVSTFVLQLRRLATVIEDTHEPVAPSVKVKLKIDGKSVARASAPMLPCATSPNDVKVIQALEPNNWLPIEAVIKRTKLPKGTVYGRLTRLLASGQVDSSKEGKRTVYRRVLQQPRPGAVAGTQAAPPVGPPSASGTPRNDAHAEVVWNGTKERNGQAPHILPPRERRP